MAEKKDYYQGLTEQFVVETFPDGLLHRYFTSLQIDADKNDITSTAVLTCPYDKQIMAYWQPGYMSCRIYGGIIDREILFSGRVREVDQTGYEIQITIENIGWKLKQLVNPTIVRGLVGEPVETVVKKLLSILRIKYHVNLSGISNLDQYTLDDGGSVKYKDKQVESIPELTTVIKNLDEFDINKLVAKTTTNHDNVYVAREFADEQLVKLDQVTKATNTYTPSYLRNSWTVADNVNLKTANRITSKDDLEYLSQMYVNGANGKKLKALKRAMKSKTQSEQNNKSESDDNGG